MKRILLVFIVLISFVGERRPSGQQPAGGSSLPSIIFIQADDLGYGDLSCYGQTKFRTPNLDRMAAEGIRFTNYYSGSTVCAPSRAALMTGLHTGHAWVRGNGDHPLRPEDITVAEVLKGAGYRTAVIGKWGLGTADTTGRPDLQGFDESFGFLDHTHAHRQYTDHLWKNGEVVKVDVEKDYVNDLFADASVSFIRSNRDRPYFLYLAFTAPHAELRAPEDSLKEFAGKFDEKPFVNNRADNVLSATPSRLRQATVGYRSQATPRAAFAAMITRMDGHVGKILNAVGPNTVIFFTSDNGPHAEGGADPVFFNSNGGLRGIKRDLYEGGIRVPMIVRWPGRIKAGAVSDQVWAHWDFLATASEIGSIRQTQQTDSLSFLPTLLGRKQKGHDWLYWEFYERQGARAMRMGEWKAVAVPFNGELELYNLRQDPKEENNVAAKNPQIVAAMRSRMDSARTPSTLFKMP